MRLTLPFPVVGINNAEKCYYFREEEPIFYLSNNYFPAVGRH